MIDHTLLKPDATTSDLDRLCKEALKHHFAGVCVNSANIFYIHTLLAHSDVLAVAVVGFPLGANSTNSKIYEAVEATRNGAQEIDMVINVGRLKSRDHAYVEEEIRKVVQAVCSTPVKVILETSLLTREEKVAVCLLAKNAGAAFVKTSTGFASGGATIEDVKLMKEVVGSSMEVKASGGIRTFKDAMAMVEAGATRIGTSCGVDIVKGLDKGASS